MIDIMHDCYKCLSEFCDTRAQPVKYRGYCLFCFIHLFPDEPVARNFKTKENNVVSFVKDEFPDLSWVVDKPIQKGTSQKRPDILLDLDKYVIIVEIDENQHRTYANICENKRLMQLSQDLKFKTCVFIRFNPDEYIRKDSTKIKSCWEPNKKGILTTSNYKSEWNNRLKRLKCEIKYWISHEPKKMIEVVELFYDEV